MKKICYILFLFQLAVNSFSQSVEFEKGNFPGKKEEFKDAVKKLDAGTDFYVQGRKEFDDKRRTFLSENRYLPISHHDHRKAGFEFFRNALSPLTDAYRFNPNN